jgi:subtilisin family serine protease
MSNGNQPEPHSRVRRLLAKRRDILVHPSDALEKDKPEALQHHYYYRPREVLVDNDAGQAEAFERAAQKLRLDYRRYENHGRPRLKGKESELASPLPAAARYHVYNHEPLEDTLRRLEDDSHGEFRATPNHVLFGCDLWGMDPYGDPHPLRDPKKAPQPGGGGAGVVVAVVDSGVPRGYTANPLLSKKIETWASEEEPWDYDAPTPVLVSPQGHGSFVIGVIRQAAQNALVRSYRALDTDGATDEWYLGHQLSLVLAGGARVVNLSLGTTSRDDQSLIGLGALEAAARGKGGTPAPIVVAAAGNLGDSRLCYPAADDWTIGVGAVKVTKSQKTPPQPASFTSFGNWVDVCANGVDVVSALENKPYQDSFAPRNVEPPCEYAVWSGTSFAAPHVSARVAEILESNPGLDRNGVLAGLKGLGNATQVANLGWFVP